jgi:hypothetical protein
MNKRFPMTGVVLAAVLTVSANRTTVGAAADLFVAPLVDTGNIEEFTPTGVQSTFASGLNWPSGLAFDRSGNLFEADQGSGNVYEFSPNGARSTFATGLDAPFGLAFAPAPEPGGITLLACGAAAVLVGWKRRR